MAQKYRGPLDISLSSGKIPTTACSFLLLCRGLELVQSSLVGPLSPSSYRARKGLLALLSLPAGLPATPSGPPSHSQWGCYNGFDCQGRAAEDRSGHAEDWGRKHDLKGRWSLFLMRVSTDHIADLGHSGS